MAFDQSDILLVEDNPADVELTLRALKAQNLANRVRVVNDGAEALDYLYPAEGEPGPTPRLIVLDLKLPKVSGLEVLQRLKADGRLKLIPVVVLTSSQEERDLVESYRHGVNGYVVKPLNFGDFAKAVAELGLYWMMRNKAPSVVDLPPI